MTDFVGKPTKINKAAIKPKKTVVSRQLLKRSRAQRRVYKLLQLIESPKDPGCSDCIGTCCKQFIVHLTKDEFDSGLYEPYAMELKQEDFINIAGIPATAAYMLVGSSYDEENSAYVLEGAPGQYCPFFDNGCTIYNKRPYTCKAYTCAGDNRITEEMKHCY